LKGFWAGTLALLALSCSVRRDAREATLAMVYGVNSDGESTPMRFLDGFGRRDNVFAAALSDPSCAGIAISRKCSNEKCNTEDGVLFFNWNDNALMVPIKSGDREIEAFHLSGSAEEVAKSACSIVRHRREILKER